MARRALWIGLSAVAVSIAVVAALAGRSLTPASLKPRLIEAAERATGRTLTISGPVGIRMGLTPTVWMRGVALANPSGFSRPDMVKVERVELSLHLLPLLRHRVEVEHILLVHPDALLESGADGRPNWIFARPAPAPGPAQMAPPVPLPAPVAPLAVPQAGSAPPPAQTRANFDAAVKDVRVQDGRIGWIDKAGHEVDFDVPLLTLSEPDARLAEINGTLVHAGRTIELTARTGSLEDLRTAFGADPWPVTAKLESGGASVLVQGAIDHPLRGRGYSLTLDSTIPDPSAFAAELPRLPLRSLHSINAHAELSDRGGPPALTALSVGVGSVDLGPVASGTRLEDVTLSATGTGPLTIAARVNAGGLDLTISGTAGDLAWLTGGRSAPFMVDLAWHGGSAQGTVKGQIEDPKRLAGYALDVAVDMPDPAAVVASAPPALKAVTFQTRLTDSGGPVPFQLNSNAGDLEGELTVSRSPRLSVVGRVTSRRLDLDLLRGAPPPDTGSGAPPAGDQAAVPSGPSSPPGPRAEAPSAGPATPPIGGQSPGPSAAAPAGPRAEARPTPQVASAPRGPVIPDEKLPLDRIRAVDADLTFALANLRLGGTDIAELNATLRIKDGVLRLDPFIVNAADRHLRASLSVDAAESPAQTHLTIDTVGVPLRPVLAALDWPPAARGLVELHADLTGTGDLTRALAASMDGWSGLVMLGGRLNTQLIDGWLRQLRPLRLDGDGLTDMRCVAVRADAKSGVVTIQPFAFDTAALILEGSGDVDLRHETLSLLVRPRTKIGNTGIALPVRVTGPMRDPTAKVDISGKGLSGGLASLLIGGKDIMGAAGGGDPCPSAIARAREGVK